MSSSVVYRRPDITPYTEDVSSVLDDFAKAVSVRVRAEVDYCCCRTNRDRDHMHEAQELEAEALATAVSKIALVMQSYADLSAACRSEPAKQV